MSKLNGRETAPRQAYMRLAIGNHPWPMGARILSLDHLRPDSHKKQDTGIRLLDYLLNTSTNAHTAIFVDWVCLQFATAYLQTRYQVQ